jgi:hypothetical protein
VRRTVLPGSPENHIGPLPALIWKYIRDFTCTCLATTLRRRTTSIAGAERATTIRALLDAQHFVCVFDDLAVNNYDNTHADRESLGRSTQIF